MSETFVFDGRALLRDALPATQFQDAGKAWNSDLHFTGATADTAEVSFVCGLLKKFAGQIVAYHIFPDCNDPYPVGTFIPGMFSIELQFAETPAGQAALEQCRREYRKGKGKRQHLGFDESPIHKRLQCKRFYRLPDGRAFLYLGKWDRHGNLWGKVLVRWNDDGMGQLANEIVPRETLQRCELIPRGEEPFALG